MKVDNLSKMPDLGREMSGEIIRCAINVHKRLGPGLLEKVYEECLLYELQKSEIKVEKQKCIPVLYDDLKIDNAFRIDLLVNDAIIVELKAVDKLLPIHDAQILTYMKLSKSPLGLLINFNEPLLKNGVRRFALSEQR